MLLLRLDMETNEVTTQPRGEMVGEVVATREDSPKSIQIKLDPSKICPDPSGDNPANMQRASSWHA